ncbi:hypothetical protein G6F63_013419 [Rhizopus arrhizus]|nr:hypothetical protein G6F63_013419 [Rhizopus arrhizus]
MHGAAVLQVANHGDVGTVQQLAQARELGQDRIQVQQGLTGVFTRAVTAVDHRDVGGAREFRDRTLVRMADHHGVHVAAHDAAGVIDGFALGHRRKRKARRVADRATQAAERRTEADAGTRAGFEEQVAQHGAFQQVAIAVAHRVVKAQLDHGIHPAVLDGRRQDEFGGIGTPRGGGDFKVPRRHIAHVQQSARRDSLPGQAFGGLELARQALGRQRKTAEKLQYSAR